MLKVNEFETAHYGYQGNAKHRFSDEANVHYRYSNADILLDNLDDLSKMIQHHQENQRPRLKVLRDYYEGNNTNILRNKRRREEHLADHRATHGFAEYVSGFIQGYLVGIPIKTSYPDDLVDEQLRDINRLNDADEHNSDLVLDQSIYGRAYELLYRNTADEIRFTTIETSETFVVYDDTVEMKPIAGVRYIYNQFSEETTVYLYTDDKIIEYGLGNDFKLTLKKESSHHFDSVPIIEYENNKFRLGDFERVLNLIDLYDEAQSDTSNYMTDLNDAMLVIKGNLDIDKEEAKEQKEYNLLMLQTETDAEGRSGQADANYIYKQYDVQGTEKYKDRVKNDIHMFTHTPNMDDESFSGTQSGEALKYKLFGLEQKRATKERLFKKALRNRYRLINNIMTIASEGQFDVNELSIVFTPNLPKSLNEEIEAFTKLGGDLSDETKLSLLSIVENPQEEIEKIQTEKESRANDISNYSFADIGSGIDGEDE